MADDTSGTVDPWPSGRDGYAALIEALTPWKCCGSPSICGATCQDDELSATLARAYELMTHNAQALATAGRYCLCSDPDYCLRYMTPDARVKAIAYRREHGAAVPADAAQTGRGEKP